MTSKMLRGAISSANRHGVNIHPGSPNSATGNCAFESVISNVNDRSCFNGLFPLSADYYRRIWITDFKNKTVDDPTWNIYSNKQWEEGWAELMVSGVYERGLFGDLMMFAIACGVRKVLLIFNTNLNSPHDPIYVCDPRKFGIEPDSVFPVVLAYDLAHYESLHPSTPKDDKAASVLVDTYLNGRYSFGKNDLPALLNTNDADLAGNQEEAVCMREEEPIKKEEMTKSAKRFQDNLLEHLRWKKAKDMTS